MVTYKYKLYRTDKTKHLDKMLAEACFVWNHALALQKRYYRFYGRNAFLGNMVKHFQKRYRRSFLSAQNRNEILERLEHTFNMFFKGISLRPPKYKKIESLNSIVFKSACNHGKIGINSCILSGNTITLVLLNKSFKFSKSREYEGVIKRVILKRNKLGEYFIYVVTDAEPMKYGKSRNGASVGIDFGLKTYLTMSNGLTIENPQYMKENLTKLRIKQCNLDKCRKGSNNRERNHKELAKLWDNICNKRNDFQWKLAHFLCRKYDIICIEDLQTSKMRNGLKKKARTKLNDLSHYAFMQKLEYVATKYGVLVHKIDRYYPSSKTCTCGYVYKDLKLSDRQWTCPHCGTTHDRDLLAANNILRRGIYELESGSKTSKHSVERRSRLHPTITRVKA